MYPTSFFNLGDIWDRVVILLTVAIQPTIGALVYVGRAAPVVCGTDYQCSYVNPVRDFNLPPVVSRLPPVYSKETGTAQCVS